MTGRAIDAEKALPGWVRANNLAVIPVYWFVKLLLCTFFDDSEGALIASIQFNKYRASQQGIVINTYAVLFDSVARLSLYRNASWIKKTKYRVQIKINEVMLKKWADNSPTNSLHMYHLVKFLYEWQISGNMERAKTILEKVIQLAKKHGDTMIYAYAIECGIKFYLASGNEKKANEHKTAAYSCYAKWGAAGLLNKLSKVYPEMVKSDVRITQIL